MSAIKIDVVVLWRTQNVSDQVQRHLRSGMSHERAFACRVAQN